MRTDAARAIMPDLVCARVACMLKQSAPRRAAALGEPDAESAEVRVGARVAHPSE